MAYVLGLVFSDGSVEDSPQIRGKYLRFTSTDRELVELVKNSLSSMHTIVTYRRGERHKRGYFIRIGSHRLCDRLAELGVTPRKSLTMVFPILDERYLADFVRGYFDGDGCAHVEHKDGIPTRLVSIFTSGSSAFLETLALHLAKIGMTHKRVYAHGSTSSAYQLRYSTGDSLRLYLLLYGRAKKPGLCLSRKWVIFDSFLKHRRLSTADIAMELTRPGGEVVTRRSAKSICAGSIPAQASRAK